MQMLILVEMLLMKLVEFKVIRIAEPLMGLTNISCSYIGTVGSNVMTRCATPEVNLA